MSFEQFKCQFLIFKCIFTSLLSYVYFFCSLQYIQVYLKFNPDIKTSTLLWCNCSEVFRLFLLTLCTCVNLLCVYYWVWLLHRRQTPASSLCTTCHCCNAQTWVRKTDGAETEEWRTITHLAPNASCDVGSWALSGLFFLLLTALFLIAPHLKGIIQPT